MLSNFDLAIFLYKKIQENQLCDESDMATISTNTDTITSNTYTTSANSITGDNSLTATYTYGTTAVNSAEWIYQPYAYDYGVSMIGNLTEDKIREILKEYDKEKEKENMTTDFSFGPYNTSSIRLSPYGMAIKNKAGKWISYNKTTDRLMDVDVINVDIESSKVFYKIPRAVNTVKTGDIILHNTTPVFVEGINNGRFTVINPYEGTEITILPAQSPFGFDFVTAIVTLTDFMPAADEDNPFGNLLPFMLMGKDNNNLGLMLALSGNMKDMDPMMMMALCGGSDMSTLLMLSMMNKKDKKKEFTKAFNKKHATYGPGIEDKDE